VGYARIYLGAGPKVEGKGFISVATKICTVGGSCVTCGGFSAEEIRRLVEAEEKAGAKYFCCSSGDKMGCVRIEHITTITEVALDEEGEEIGEEGEGRPEEPEDPRGGATRECPFCKEEINAEAVKCKHCGSRVSAEGPTHGGTCPYCKESIKPEAIKCMHCGSYVGPGQPVFEGRMDDCRDCGDREVTTAVMQQRTGTGLPWESDCSRMFYVECMTAPPPGVPGSNQWSWLNRDPFMCSYYARLMCGEVRTLGGGPWGFSRA
jgi:hypothetical protein